ncbi:LYR motif-containing protein bcn92 [Haematobia irritans]
MSSTRRLAKALYRKLLREAEKLPSYNFRMYAGRKIRDTFRENKTINDFDKIDAQIELARQNLQMLRRQAIIGHLYTAEKLVIENKKTLRPSDD